MLAQELSEIGPQTISQMMDKTAESQIQPQQRQCYIQLTEEIKRWEKQ